MDAKYTLKPGQELVIRGPGTIHVDGSVSVKVAQDAKMVTIIVESVNQVTKSREDQKED